MNRHRKIAISPPVWRHTLAGLACVAALSGPALPLQASDCGCGAHASAGCDRCRTEDPLPGPFYFALDAVAGGIERVFGLHHHGHQGGGRGHRCDAANCDDACDSALLEELMIEDRGWQPLPPSRLRSQPQVAPRIAPVPTPLETPPETPLETPPESPPVTPPNAPPSESDSIFDALSDPFKDDSASYRVPEYQPVRPSSYGRQPLLSTTPIPVTTTTDQPTWDTPVRIQPLHTTEHQLDYFSSRDTSSP